MPDGDASVFVDQIFRIFDKDENGSIDFNVIFLNLFFTWFSDIIEGIHGRNRYDFQWFYRRKTTMGF